VSKPTENSTGSPAPRKAGPLALKVAGTYVVVGTVWILFSDGLVDFLISDPATRIRLSIFKGLAFVILTGSLLQLVLWRALKRWELEAERRATTMASLRRTKRALRTLSGCNQVLVRADNEPALLKEICRLIIERGGYRMAWVGFAENNPQKSVRVDAHAGCEEGYLEQAKISWSDADKNGRGPTGLAIRNGETVVCNDFQNDLRTVPWRAEGRRLGYLSSLSIPLKNDGRNFGVLTIYAGELNAFNPTEVQLLTELADDLAYGINTLRTRIQHQQAEDELQRREQNYREIFNATNEAIFLHEIPTGRILDVNDTMLRMYGCASKAEVVASRVADWSADEPPYTQAEAAENIRRAIEEGPQVFEWRARKKNGERFWVEVSLRSSEVADQRRVLAVVRDITGRKQEEEKLRRALAESEQFRTALDQVSALVFIKDLQSRYLYGNQQTLNFFGCTAGELAGSADERFFPPDTAKRLQEIDARVLRGEPTHEEIELCDRQGQRHVYLEIKTPIYAEAQSQTIIGLLGISTDITERKRAEAIHLRLATAVEQATDTIVITDTDGTIIYVNPAFEKTTGFTRAESIGQNPRMLKSGKQDTVFYRQMWATIQSGKVWTGHFINKRKDGTLCEEDATITPIRNAAGKITNFVAVKRDVTHELQLEAQFRQAQKMEAMGTLAGGIAHDFNNILTVIFGYSYMLQHETEQNSSVQEKVREILKAADRAKDLVQQILTFSRQHEQQRQVIRLDSVIKEATKFLRASLPANIQIDLNLAADAPAVLADPTQIYQVTLNLATNALHAMEGRQGCLTVKLEAFTPDEPFLATHAKFRPIRYTRLTIADTGHGMEAKTLERIFEPFFTTKPVGKGTGLGLAVVHGIIQSHDGIITVESRVGAGTTFGLYFPAQLLDEAITKPGLRKLPQGHGQKILVVDDEVVLTNAVEQLLKLLNYQATISNRPRAAIALVRENPAAFDLVITDLTMPEINGLEVATEIHRLRPELPIILATGFRASLTTEDLRKAGICELLEKPMSLVKLAEALHAVLGGKNEP
jgi:PAS domain S-box-containing protein